MNTFAKLRSSQTGAFNHLRYTIPVQPHPGSSSSQCLTSVSQAYNLCYILRDGMRAFKGSYGSFVGVQKLHVGGTANSHPPKARAALAMHADEFISRPTAPNVLLQHIKNFPLEYYIRTMPLFLTLDDMAEPSLDTLMRSYIQIYADTSELCRRLLCTPLINSMQEIKATLPLTQRLRYLFAHAATWELNKQAKVDTVRSVARTVDVLSRMDRILGGWQTAKDNTVPLLSGHDIIRVRPHIFGQWAAMGISVDKLRGIRQELGMVIDLMELMQHVNDQYLYEPSLAGGILTLC
jgi:hypothetical protein